MRRGSKEKWEFKWTVRAASPGVRCRICGKQAFPLDWPGRPHTETSSLKIPSNAYSHGNPDNYGVTGATLKPITIAPLLLFCFCYQVGSPDHPFLEAISHRHTCPVLSPCHSCCKLLFSLAFPLMKKQNIGNGDPQGRLIHLCSKC